MRRLAVWVATIALALAGVGEAPENAPRATVQAYLDALARGDGNAACALLHPAVYADTRDLVNRADCERELSYDRDTGRRPITGVKLESPNEARVTITSWRGPITPYGQSRYFRWVTVVRQGDRWLLGER